MLGVSAVWLSHVVAQSVGISLRNPWAPARQIMHAHVLLKADSGPKGPNWSDERIHEAFGVSVATIWRIRCRFEESGLEDALTRRPQPERPDNRKIAGEQETHLIALTCSPAPEGHQRWTMRLLADRMVQLGYMDAVSHQTVWQVLMKRCESKCRPGRTDATASRSASIGAFALPMLALSSSVFTLQLKGKDA